jgi:transcription elongation factor Elf1
MSQSSSKGKPAAELPKIADFTFTCKFCGETKPLSELVLMREYFPPIPSCRACSVKNKLKEEETLEETLEEETEDNSQ